MRGEAAVPWLRVAGLSFCLCFLDGCGTVGPPVPPEFVGIGARLQKDKEKERLKEEERRKALERKEEGKPTEPGVTPEEEESTETDETAPTIPPEEDVILPPLRPIGVQPGSLPEQ